MGIVEKFIKEGQLTKEEYPELLHLYQDPDTVSSASGRGCPYTEKNILEIKYIQEV